MERLELISMAILERITFGDTYEFGCPCKIFFLRFSEVKICAKKLLHFDILELPQAPPASARHSGGETAASLSDLFL